MLNISEELSNYKPIEIESVEQKIGNIPEDMKCAFDMYNKALEDIKSNNEDIAIIALKKATALYPGFYEAMNLMGICYVSLGEEENARRMFKKIIEMDDNSIRASNYLDILDGKIPSEEPKTRSFKSRDRNKRERTIASWIGSGLESEKKPYFFKYILGYLLGLFTICLVWLLVPVNKPIIIDFKDLFNKPAVDSAQLEDLKKRSLDLEKRLSDAMSALETAKQTEKQLQDQMEQYIKWSEILRDLQNLADDGKYKEVVIEIEKNLVGLDLPKKIEDEIIALNNECRPKAIRQFYDSGKNTYKANAKAKSLETYQQAASDFKMAIRIMEELQEKPSYIADLYYYGGKATALSEFPTKAEADQEAIKYFKAVISAAPKSDLAKSAQSRINEIEAGKAIKH